MDEDVAIPHENGLMENDEKPTSINRLLGLVNKLETENSLSSSNSEKTLENGFHNGHTTENDICSLENASEVTDPEFNRTINSEDENSWLYESPQKIQTPGKGIQTPEKWLTENLTTPELLRVRGSLSAKLDVMKIEKRKGLFHTDPQHRKISNIRKESMQSVNSLDWDYDEDKDNESRSRSLNAKLDDDDDFDPEKELSLAYQKINSDLERQAWSEPAIPRGQSNANDSKPFSLDWSDDEDELVPMKIDFNSPPNDVKPRGGAVVRRGVGSTINQLAAPRQSDQFDHEDFVAKPSGGVKPRRAVAPRAAVPEYDEDFAEDDFNDSAPVVPRGAPKRAKRSESLKSDKPKKHDGGAALKRGESLKRASFAEDILINPSSAGRKNHSAELLKKVHNTPSPRTSAGIAKPVQRRKASDAPPSNSGSGVRPRGSIGQIKPRGSIGVPKSSSAPSDVGDSSLVAKIPSGDGGSGAVARRRGAGSDAGIPAPRKSKESPQIARVQGGIPQSRKSTGSIPQMRSEGGVRPRRSASPSGIARPRGSGPTTQSMQANY
ncbi:uncharacterized protein [Clytia hemisphaerica]|uniref:uncharacterized protein isoform X2 n=1 Tax=Clytia hemisphaerica TaxID=252671 RepID=UPI0034D5A1F9